jgi:hypothetical protein
MRFTYDMWTNRVLPAWRQIMGRNGGWHEGGEYVGVGIGQAIYELPAMWRSATGEPLRQRTGIGDFGFSGLSKAAGRYGFDGATARHSTRSFPKPSARPRALTCQRTTFARGHDAEPTGWPWGPLTNTSLNDLTASANLPLARQFDGIGMIVARSGWSLARPT